MSDDARVRRTIDAVWRIESAKIIARIARMVGDVGVAEDLAQDAFVAALERWPETGVPDNPGAWLMQAAKYRTIDHLRLIFTCCPACVATPCTSWIAWTRPAPSSSVPRH